MFVPDEGLVNLPVVLASGSPRRASLLRQIGLPFEVTTSNETEPAFIGGGESPADFARRMARQKMQSVAGRRQGRLVLAADTLVVIDNTVLGKPTSAMEATEMLSTLSGRTHEVITGVVVGFDSATESGCVERHAITRVTFSDMAMETIRTYVATGEPMDKAGAYGIQGRGACLVKHIEGCYSNVVGLPLQLTTTLLRQFGVDIELAWSIEAAAIEGHSDASE